MDLTELNNLISIRDYVINVMNNSAFDRSIVNDLSAMSILLDKKIVALLRDSEFKNYIKFSDAGRAIKEVADLNNIKSGIKQ